MHETNRRLGRTNPALVSVLALSDLSDINLDVGFLLVTVCAPSAIAPGSVAIFAPIIKSPAYQSVQIIMMMNFSRAWQLQQI